MLLNSFEGNAVCIGCVKYLRLAAKLSDGYAALVVEIGLGIVKARHLYDELAVAFIINGVSITCIGGSTFLALTIA